MNYAGLPIRKSRSTEKSIGPKPDRSGEKRPSIGKRKALCWSLGRGLNPRPAAFLLITRRLLSSATTSGICQAEPPRRPAVILKMMLKILPYEAFRVLTYRLEASSSAAIAGNFSPASIDSIAPPAVLTCENLSTIPNMLA